MIAFELIELLWLITSTSTMSSVPLINWTTSSWHWSDRSRQLCRGAVWLSRCYLLPWWVSWNLIYVGTLMMQRIFLKFIWLLCCINRTVMAICSSLIFTFVSLGVHDWTTCQVLRWTSDSWWYVLASYSTCFKSITLYISLFLFLIRSEVILLLVIIFIALMCRCFAHSSERSLVQIWLWWVT